MHKNGNILHIFNPFFLPELYIEIFNPTTRIPHHIY